ncbi:MAG TPA: phosphohistidine phosphatase SixA [Gaiellaceae bacterium]|nr:phosphohistidine phosphatase SixA [Gaiellaceae bacterium]
MRVYLVRHGEAAPGEPDEERRLTPEGREQSRRVAEQLASAQPRPDAVLHSPLVRARETAELIAAPLGIEPEPDDRLAPGATTDNVRAAAAGRGEAVVLVGHQPDCGRVAAELTGGPEPAFPAGGMVVIDL